VPAGWVARPVEDEAVLDVLVVEVVDDHGEDVPDAELVEERDHGVGLGLPLVEQGELARRRVARIDAEVHAAGHDPRAKRDDLPRAQLDALELVGRVRRGLEHKKRLHR